MTEVAGNRTGKSHLPQLNHGTGDKLRTSEVSEAIAME